MSGGELFSLPASPSGGDTNMSRKFRAVRLRTRLILIGAIGAVLVLIGGLAASAQLVPSGTGASITSDKADYAPGSTVVLTGASWASSETVHIVVNDTIGKTWKIESGLNGAPADPVADSNGGFTYSFNLPNTFVSDYDVTATGPSSGTATTTFTDNISINMDQCQNGTNGSDPCNDTDPTDWARGDLVSSKARYNEGDSIPQRMIIGGINGQTSGSVAIEYDTTKSNKHAFDYLTTWNRTVAASDPCAESGTNHCSGSPVLAPIPTDPLVAAKGFSQLAGNFALWNGTITNVSSVTSDCAVANRPDACGDSSSTITISFTANGPANQSTDVVLAWGAHIATRANWGANNSAVAITRSPYHTALNATTLSASQGQKDLQTQSAAVFFPSSITIIKQATPEGSTSFPFTASPSPLANFDLVDDGTATNTKSFTQIFNYTSYTVTESVPSGWNLDSISNPCTVTSPNGGSTTVTLAQAKVVINLAEGEDVTCTFNDSISVFSTSTSTELHKGSTDGATPDVISVGGSVPLGSSVHDSATVSKTDSFALTGTATFQFFKNATCTGTPFATATGVSLTNGVADPALAQTNLAAGDYAYRAKYVAGSDSHHTDSAFSSCENFTVNAGSTSTSTELHKGATDSGTPDVLAVGGSVALGSSVHDSATVTTSDSFGLAGTATFQFFKNATCTGTPDASATGVALVAGVADPALAKTSLAAGTYAYRAKYVAGTDTNHTDSAFSSCENFTVSAGSTSTSTELHKGATDAGTPDVLAVGGSVALGSSVHDSATVSTSDSFGLTGTATFQFFKNGTCTGTPDDSATGVSLTSGKADPALAQTNLAPGDYAYRAKYVAGSDTNHTSSAYSSCENFTVSKAPLTIATTIHDASHGVIAEGSVIDVNSIVHDTANVGGKIGTFATGDVTFSFYGGSKCSNGAPIATAGTIDPTNNTPRSIDTSALASWSYGFKATVADNVNDKGATSSCEPFRVVVFGKTMGFWGNKNGIQRIKGNGGYAANAINIGRGAAIDTQAESAKVLPNTLNACGKGSPIIFSDQTQTKDCSVASGINKNSLNTLAAQTLALGYNIKIVSGFSGQTLASLTCVPSSGLGLTGSSTVDAAFTAAVSLIDGSASGGTTTQTKIGNMNQLLGCINRETQ